MSPDRLGPGTEETVAVSFVIISVDDFSQRTLVGLDDKL